MKLNIRDTEERDLPAIKRLTDEYISRDYYSLEDLRACLSGDPEGRNLFYVVTDADRNDEVVSYFYAFVAPLQEALRIVHVKEKPEALANYDGDTPVAVYKLSSTEKEYQKHGLCSSFVRDLEPVVRERGARMILATAVRPLGREEPMRHIFCSNGFHVIAVMPRLWGEVPVYCPYCKQNPCVCDGIFYVKKLDGTEVEDICE